MPRPGTRSPLLAAVLAVVLVGCGGSGAGRERAAGATDDGPAAVVSVTDGDTFRAEVGGTEERIRLIGVNTPEAGECLADEAGAALQELLDGAELRLEADVSDRDRFGRLLRYVHAGDVLVNAALVEQGLAIAQRFEPDVARAAELEEAERRARDAGVGQWAPDACGEATGVALAVIDVVANAPGDDAVNLNGEWVVLRNDGPGPADLTGWVVKDESASHRFRFPDGFALAPGAEVTVLSGCGIDAPDRLHWCTSGSAIWNNDGDTAFVVDPNGNIVDTHPY